MARDKWFGFFGQEKADELRFYARCRRVRRIKKARGFPAGTSYSLRQSATFHHSPRASESGADRQWASEGGSSRARPALTSAQPPPGSAERPNTRHHLPQRNTPARQTESHHRDGHRPTEATPHGNAGPSALPTASATTRPAAASADFHPAAKSVMGAGTTAPQQDDYQNPHMLQEIALDYVQPYQAHPTWNPSESDSELELPVCEVPRCHRCCMQMVDGSWTAYCVEHTGRAVPAYVTFQVPEVQLAAMGRLHKGEGPAAVRSGAGATRRDTRTGGAPEPPIGANPRKSQSFNRSSTQAAEP